MKLLPGGLAGGSSGRTTSSDQPQQPGLNDCYNVLFVCADNSVKSLIAEAILKRWGGHEFRAFSAGIAPLSACHPLAAEVLKEQRVWNDGLHSKGCQEFLAPGAPPMDFVISLGEQPPASLPNSWPGHPKVIHWHISEPMLDGKAPLKTQSLRRTFLELENRIKLMVLVYQHDAMRSAATAA
ncbi:MAG TPA: hypothetical protein VMT58_08975 [Candidatus Binataceae bacterium]|nr:hypothetical protein [Candidatus Binataceae bacterium]